MAVRPELLGKFLGEFSMQFGFEVTECIGKRELRRGKSGVTITNRNEAYKC